MNQLAQAVAVDDIPFCDAQIFSDGEFRTVNRGWHPVVIDDIIDEVPKPGHHVFAASFQSFLHRRGVTHQHIGRRPGVQKGVGEQTKTFCVTVVQIQVVDALHGIATPGNVAFLESTIRRIAVPDRVGKALVRGF
nr:hypothetical protein [Ruegeria lacuscaerulensis]